MSVYASFWVFFFLPRCPELTFAHMVDCKSLRPSGSHDRFLTFLSHSSWAIFLASAFEVCSRQWENPAANLNESQNLRNSLTCLDFFVVFAVPQKRDGNVPRN